jgi:hypothetical protein
METPLIKQIPVGIHKDISIEDYHADRDYISASGVKEAIKSLRHFQYARTTPKVRKSHFDFGNVFEIALLDYVNGTMEFFDKVIVFDPEERPEKEKGITSTINQNWKKEIFNGDKYVIEKTGSESMETLVEMLQSCARDAVIQKLLRNTEYQNSLFWECPESGLKLKARPDISKKHKNVIVDIKTTLDASPKGFAKQVANLDYPTQAMIQINGAVQTGLMEKVDVYYWLAVEKTPPYNAQIYEFDKNDWQFVDDRLNYHLKILKQAIDENKFVGYGQQADNSFGILTLELPMFYRF